MNDQQLVDALRAIGSRPAAPLAPFSERLWDELARRRAARPVAIRRDLLLVAALALLAAAMFVAAAGGLFRDGQEHMIATVAPTQTAAPAANQALTPEPTLDMAALLGPWQPAPIAVPDEFARQIEIACRAQWFESEELFGREHRGGDYVYALLDVRGEGRATLGFQASDGRVNFCNVEFTGRGQYQAGMATSGEAPLASPFVLPPTQMVHGMSWSDRGGTPGSRTHASGPYGQAGDQISTAVMESAGNPPVTVSIANGLWTYWVPWIWDAAQSTVTGFDAEGVPVFTLPWP